VFVGTRAPDIRHPVPGASRADLDIDLSLRRRSRKSAQKKESKQLRIVAALNEEDWYYHLYVTNISSDVLEPEEIARLYGARLDLDLVFKQLKSRYALDLVDTTRPQIIEAYTLRRIH